MTRWYRWTTLTAVVGLTLMGLLLRASVVHSAVATMTKEDLRAKLESPGVVIIDVRLGKDWKASEEKIKGAIRVDAAEIESVAATYPKDTTLVLYCA